jgi:hypothetical protein
MEERIVQSTVQEGEEGAMNKAITVPPCADKWEGELPLFVLNGLLPVGQALSVNTDCLIVSLVSTKTASATFIQCHIIFI